MMETKLIVLSIVIALCSTVTALDCYQCFEVGKCLGQEKDKIVSCSNATSQEMVEKSKRFYPKLAESLVYDGSYQCASLSFTPLGAQNATEMFKGCLFKTNSSLCSMDASISNGNFSCHACNTNKCNSGVALGWSFAVMMISLMALSLVTN